MDIVTIDDLPQDVRDSELAGMFLAGANARAKRVAPCLLEDGKDDARAEAKMILIGAIRRWAEAGPGAIQQQSAGPFAMTLDTRQKTGFNLWPSEITDLQDLCAGEGSFTKAFVVDTVPTGRVLCHAEDCSRVFGAAYCSCGAVLTGSGPLWE